jgi:hypothetical protein
VFVGRQYAAFAGITHGQKVHDFIERRRYFKQQLGEHIRDDEYPRLVFGKRPNVTVRYFPDKLPIGHDDDHRRHVFMYLARSPSPMDFRVFILRHLELFNALGFWTIRVWFPRVLAHAMEAYRNAANELLLRVHLAKAFGDKRLDEISTEDVQRLKAALTERAPKTVNNVLTVLSVVLRTAVE